MEVLPCAAAASALPCPALPGQAYTCARHVQPPVAAAWPYICTPLSAPSTDVAASSHRPPSDHRAPPFPPSPSLSDALAMSQPYGQPQG